MMAFLKVGQTNLIARYSIFKVSYVTVKNLWLKKTLKSAGGPYALTQETGITGGTI